MAFDPLFDRWVHCPRPRPDASLRLFCLPYAGAGASVFFDWPQRVPPNIEICGIQLPGRENRIREEPYRDVVSLARELLCILAPALDLPFAVFGHSMGALLGFELVRQITEAGGTMPSRLLVAASRPPHGPNRRPSVGESSDELLLAEVLRLGGTPLAVLENQELMALVLPTLRADFTVHETYNSEDILDVPITAFGGASDPEVSLEEIGGWAMRTRKDFRCHTVEGDHFFLRTSRDALLALLISDLDAASTLGCDLSGTSLNQSSAYAPVEDRHSGVEFLRRLFEGDAPGTVEDRRVTVLAANRRQIVHEHRTGLVAEGVHHRSAHAKRGKALTP
jgi:medium-chain acyl-[acyl-carrier-protein] hydrolase